MKCSMNGFDVVLNRAHFFTHGSKFSFVIYVGFIAATTELFALCVTRVDDYQMPPSDNLTP